MYAEVIFAFAAERYPCWRSRDDVRVCPWDGDDGGAGCVCERVTVVGACHTMGRRSVEVLVREQVASGMAN